MTLFMAQAAFSAVCTSDFDQNQKLEVKFFPDGMIYVEHKTEESLELLVGEKAPQSPFFNMEYEAYSQKGEKKLITYSELHTRMPAPCRTRVCNTHDSYVIKTLKIEDEYFTCL